MAFDVRIVRRIHQDVIADQVDDGTGQLGAFGNLDALEITSTSNVLARLLTKFRERGFDRLGMFVKVAVDPKRAQLTPGCYLNYRIPNRLVAKGR
jgi:hypothetical protein